MKNRYWVAAIFLACLPACKDSGISEADGSAKEHDGYFLDNGLVLGVHRVACPAVSNAGTLTSHEDVVQDGIRYIYNVDQFASFARSKSAMNKAYVQCRDLDFAGFYSAANRYFTVAGDLYSFNGTYDFNYYKVKNYKFSSSGAFAPTLPIMNAEGSVQRESFTYVGLFARIGANARVRNLILEGASVEVPQPETQLTAAFVGALAGPNALVEKIDVRDPQVVARRRVGGAFGRVVQGATAKYVSVRGGAVEGINRVGGLVGEVYRNSTDATIPDPWVQNATANTLVKVRCGEALSEDGSKYYGGGLIGRLDEGRVTKSIARSTVVADAGLAAGATQLQIGGFTGRITDATVEWSYAAGEVTAPAGWIGGFAGTIEFASIVRNSYAATEIEAGSPVGSGSAVGGFTGKDYPDTGNGNSRTEFCYAAGAINVASSSVRAGGFYGDWRGDTGDLADVFSVASVTATASNSGVKRFSALSNGAAVGLPGLYFYAGSTCVGSSSACQNENATARPSLASFHEPDGDVLSGWTFGVGQWWPKVKFAAGQIQYVGTPQIYGAGFGGINETVAAIDEAPIDDPVGAPAM